MFYNVFWVKLFILAWFSGLLFLFCYLIEVIVRSIFTQIELQIFHIHLTKLSLRLKDNVVWDQPWKHAGPDQQITHSMFNFYLNEISTFFFCTVIKANYLKDESKNSHACAVSYSLG